MEKSNRLYRSSTSRIFGGVAGGIAEYFDVDPIIIRMLFVIIAFAGGGGVLVYVILWIAIPQRPILPPDYSGFGDPSSPPPPPGSFGTASEPSQSYNAEPIPPAGMKPERSNRGGLIGGLILITLGSIFLADRFIPRVDFGDLWPIILVVVGAVLIVTNFSEQDKGKAKKDN